MDDVIKLEDGRVMKFVRQDISLEEATRLMARAAGVHVNSQSFKMATERDKVDIICARIAEHRKNAK